MHLLTVVIHNFAPRGVQRARITLANEFLRLGYEVHAISFSNVGSLRNILDPNVKVFNFENSSTKYSLIQILFYITRFRPKAIFSAQDNVNVLFIILKILSFKKFRLSISCHVDPNLWALHPKIFSKDSFLKMFVHYTYSLADQVVFLSSEMQEKYHSIFKFNNLNDRVIFNPVKIIKNTDFKLIQSVSQGHRIPLIIGVGHLSKIKGFDFLIRAFHVLRRKIDVRLQIVGSGPEKLNLVTLSNELGLDNCVEFVDFHSDPKVLMQEADAFVLSSRSVGLPTVLIEALVCGCPSISTRCRGGALEILEFGRLGRFVDFGDIDGLAVAIFETLKDPIPRAVLQKSSERFESEKIAKRYLELLVS